MRWTLHSVIVVIRDNDYTRVLLYPYYTTLITGRGVPPKVCGLQSLIVVDEWPSEVGRYQVDTRKTWLV